MPKLPGINHQRGIITIPRANPVDAYTMAGIVRDAGLSIDEFKNLL
jgi:hypothetical protein